MIEDNLPKLQQVAEEEIPGMCRAKAIKTTEMIEAELPDCKIATHCEMGHRAPTQSYHDCIATHYEKGRDWVETVLLADEKNFIEINVAILPLKLPEQFRTD
mgnify:CR=1 FL=1